MDDLMTALRELIRKVEETECRAVVRQVTMDRDWLCNQRPSVQTPADHGAAPRQAERFS